MSACATCSLIWDCTAVTSCGRWWWNGPPPDDGRNLAKRGIQVSGDAARDLAENSD
jgi:hypothetical protein